MKWDRELAINQRRISLASPAFFIADIAANHDGELSRAKELIWLAKQAGADCAKFQHFQAAKIVSDYGFTKLSGGQQSHQAKWKKSVYETYKQYECKREWTDELKETAAKANIDFLTSPYDMEAVDALDHYLPAFKIGSGDITWLTMLEYIAKKNKPVLLACGASTMEEVDRAVQTIIKYNSRIVLMQCNTNYTASSGNVKYVNLAVLKTFAATYPGMLLGLSDHTSGHATVLGAIALGARIIEKHFTDDNARIGPDHLFAMNPATWKEMMERSRELECALGDGIKRVEKNEADTVIIQRRCLRLNKMMRQGNTITNDCIDVLRPAPQDAFKPYELETVIGKILNKDKEKGSAISYKDVG